MAYTPNNPNGQAVMANSSPVVIASDQTAIPISTTLIQGLTDTQLRASDVKITLDGETVPVTGTFWQVTQPVSIATLPTLAAGTNNIGDVDVLTLPNVTLNAETTKVIGTVNLSAAQTLANVTTLGTITNVVHIDDNGSTISIDDGAGSITVDGTVAATQSGTWILGANSGIDIGDVTINNAAGASAVNIQDGGNSITIDGTVAVSNSTFPVTDNAGSLTIDAPVGTPVFVRLSDGAAPITTLPVSLATNTPTLQSGSTTAVTQATGSNLHMVLDSGTLSTITNPVGIKGYDGLAIASITNPLTDSIVDSEISLSNRLTSLRDILTAERFTGAQYDSLADGISAMWTTNHANGGAASSTGGAGALTTSTATNGQAQLLSTTVYYYPGQVAWFNSAVAFTTAGTAGNIRTLGVATVSGTSPQDGYYYELNGTTFNIVSAKGGVLTRVASTSWSKFSTAPFTIDTGFHAFEILYTANSAKFYIDGILRHELTSTTALTNTLSFNILIQNIKTSGATNITLEVRNIGTGAFGSPFTPIVETGVSAVRAVAVGGGTPHDSVDSGNPIKTGAVARLTTFPTSVAQADRTNNISDRHGRVLTSHIDAGQQIWKNGEYTTTQTGTNIWTPTSGNRFVITSLTIATGGTTAALVTIWGAPTGTTAFAAGTDQQFFRGVLTPSASATPGAIYQVSVPMYSDTTNDCLKITTSTGITVYITVYGYEITP